VLARGLRGLGRLVPESRLAGLLAKPRTAVGTGNCLLRSTLRSPNLAYALFEAELGSPG
jgi:hypothetical protein